jgi:hypothetical protein
MPYGLARHSRWALLTGVAGACIMLSACGGGTSASSQQTSSDLAHPAARAVSTAQFCRSVTSVMRDTAARVSGQDHSLNAERARLEKALAASAKGYSTLESQAPRQLRGVVGTIASQYRLDERLVASAKSLSQINISLVKANASGRGGEASQKLLMYMQGHCK